MGGGDNPTSGSKSPRSLAGVQWQPQQQSGLISPQRCSVGHSGGRGGQRGYPSHQHRIAAVLHSSGCCLLLGFRKHRRTPRKRKPKPSSSPAPQSQPSRQPTRRPSRPFQQCWRTSLQLCQWTSSRRQPRQWSCWSNLLISPFFRSPEKDGLFCQPQQRLRIRPRTRPHCRPAGLAAAKDSPPAAASRGPLSHRGDSTTGKHLRTKPRLLKSMAVLVIDLNSFDTYNPFNDLFDQ